jgi:amino acid transporter
MAFNVLLAVRAAGKAAPLAFAIGTVALGIVALSFVSSSRRFAHAGSAYAYIGQAFGWRWGFVAGWTLLLTYLTYAAGGAALIGNFLQAAAQNLGVQHNSLWFTVSLGGLLLASFCAYRDVILAGLLMLVLEAISVLAIIFLCVAVLTRVARTAGLSAAPFVPAPEFRDWSGIGYAMVFCVLSFAGFEGAATLGEETRDPRRNIPIAILGTCALAGVFYVFVTYSQVVGFGIAATRDLAKAEAPLNDLAVRYISRDFATAIDVAAAISAFSCVLGSLSAAARLLFALGRAGLGPRIGEVHPVHGTPGAAVIFSGLACAGCLALWAPFTGPANFGGYLGIRMAKINRPTLVVPLSD